MIIKRMNFWKKSKEKGESNFGSKACSDYGYLVAKQIGSKVGGFRWGSCIVIITIIMIIIMNMDVKSRKSFKRFGDGIMREQPLV